MEMAEYRFLGVGIGRNSLSYETDPVTAVTDSGDQFGEKAKEEGTSSREAGDGRSANRGKSDAFTCSESGPKHRPLRTRGAGWAIFPAQVTDAPA